MHPYTVVIIARDSERSIERTIKSSLDVTAAHVCVVDTGSRDTTMSLVSNYCERRVSAHQISWPRSFSIARNHAMEYVRTPWAFFIDSDEWFPARESDDVDALITERIYSSSIRDVFCPNIEDVHSGTITTGMPRLLNRLHAQFTGAVHEYPYSTITPHLALRYEPLPITIYHDGYAPDIIRDQRKIERNIDLLECMIEAEPSTPRWRYYMLRDGGSISRASSITTLLDAVLESDKPTAGDPTPRQRYELLGLVEGCSQLIAHGQFAAVESYIEFLERTAGPRHPDYNYITGLFALIYDPDRAAKTLRNAALSRQDQLLVSQSVVDATGSALDAIIGALLVITRGIDIANEYLSHCHSWTDRFFDRSRFRGWAERVPA